MPEQLTLGELESMLKRKDPEWPIYFDFVHFVPAGIHSYRGDYSEIALGYGHEPTSVGDVLKLVREAIGHKFDGYKGGKYLMDSATPVFVANPDECGRTAVVDVRESGSSILLITDKLD